MTENVMILGATSGIARALCHVMSQRGARLVLAGRNVEALEEIAADLDVRYHTRPVVQHFDALDYDGHETLVADSLRQIEGPLTGAVLCYGSISNQETASGQFDVARNVIDVNFTSSVSVLERLARYLESQGQGYLACISSVAGDRGRQSNYTYGASKAGLTAYLQGLRNRLCPQGIHVLTVKPGFVATPMTDGLLDPQSPLVASPQRVARDIERAIRQRKNVLYTPWFWALIMRAITGIPEFAFKRLKL